MDKRLIETVDDSAIVHVPMPPRTTFYSLPPLGMGTWAAEGTTSYIARLAATHCIKVKDFVMYALGIKVGQKSRWLIFSRQSDIVRLNGDGSVAKEVAYKLTNLTGQCCLQKTNLAHLSGTLPNNSKLLRHERAWCPQCLDDMQGKIVYEPLIWSLHFAEVCPIHRIRLSTTCPFCKAHNAAPLCNTYVVGHCVHCGEWLGRQDSGQHFPAATDLEVWTSLQIGSLVASTSSNGIEPVDRSVVRDNLKALVASIGGGYMTQFARKIGAPKSTCSMWLSGTTLPKLDYWLHISWISGQDIGKFLFGPVSAADIAQTARIIEIGTPWQKRPSRRRHNWDNIENQLAAICAANETPPPSLAQVAREFGTYSRVLKMKYRNLCELLVGRHRVYWSQYRARKRKTLEEDIERAVTMLMRNGHTPTRRRVGSELGLPSGDISDLRLQRLWQSCIARLQPHLPDRTQAPYGSDFK